MSLFSDMNESRIFKDEEVLSTEYLPKLLPHRENEIKEIARNLSPLSKGKSPTNTFIFGSPGIGKTAVTKYVFSELDDYSEQVETVYINCWDYRTPTALLTQIIISLGFFVQRRGWSRDEIIDKLKEALSKGAKGVAVCLDEVDQLEMSALYDLLRINQYVETPVGLVFISNDSYVFSKAEPRIRSSLGADEIEFKAYTLNEMKEILDERAEKAFQSYNPAIVTLCANHAVNNGGDVRVGLQCLLKAGRKAEESGAEKVVVEHVKEVLDTVKKIKPKILEDKINEHEKILLDILKDGEKLSSGDLYDEYRKRARKKFKDTDNSPVTDRSLRDFVRHLEDINLIEISEKKVGRSRLIWYNEDIVRD